MRRSLIGRAFSLVLTLWLPLFMSGAESVVRCPMHSGMPGAASHTTSGPKNVAGHQHSAEHSAPASEQLAPANHGAGHNCSCPGPGCCPTAVAVVSSVMVSLAHVIVVHEARARSSLELFSSDRDYLLPFATAPPGPALAPAASFAA